MTDTEPEMPQIKNTAMIAVGVSLLIILLIILQHNLAFQTKGTIVLPAGGTYLGPTTTDTPAPTSPPPLITATQSTTVAPGKDGSFTTAEGKFAVTKDAAWVTVKGNRYPYFFKAPAALKLVTLPGEFDIWAISWQNRPPDQNVLIGVDNLNRTNDLKQYISISKRSYVENWWKQFGGLKGVASITEFTNSAGLKGYRAKYLNSANQTPNEDVFFETPDPNYVIHVASGILDTSVFNPLIDSVGWTAK